MAGAAPWDFREARRRLEAKPKSSGEKLSSVEDAARRLRFGNPRCACR